MWSVSTEKGCPRRYLENRSHAHVTARASFSICAYLPSISEGALEAKAIGFHISPDLWRRTALRPYDDASADTFLGSYNRTLIWTRFVRISANTFGTHNVAKKFDLRLPKLTFLHIERCSSCMQLLKCSSKSSIVFFLVGPVKSIRQSIPGNLSRIVAMHR